jgi:hypothetical protein
MEPSFVAVLALLSASVASAASETRTVDRILSVTGEVDLDVSSGPGGVSITTGTSGVVRVHAVIRPLFGAADLGLAEATIQKLEQKPPIEQQGNRIRVGFVNDPGILGRVSITYDIETPRESRARAVTSSGGIRIDGIIGPAVVDSFSGRIEITGLAKEVTVKNSSGLVVIRKPNAHVTARTGSGGIQVMGAKSSVEVETTSGRTELSDIGGDVSSRTSSGSIIVDNASGAVTAANHSGSIDAMRVGGAVRAQTRSGAIRISQINEAPITARTENGAIQVDLAHHGGYEIDARSDSGKVSGPMTAGPERVVGARWLRGQIRGGGPLVDLDTRSSKITVR